MALYIALGLIFVFALLGVFIWMLEKKINRLEKIIRITFRFRTSLIPSLYEVTQANFVKHELIFRHILNLRMEEILNNRFIWDIEELLAIESKIHKELNFIFKVSHKHEKLQKNPKFIYVRDLFVESSHSIGEKLELYRKIVVLYNRYIKIKNYSIIGLLLPIKMKSEI